jgi:hypothetical protein
MKRCDRIQIGGKSTCVLQQLIGCQVDNDDLQGSIISTLLHRFTSDHFLAMAFPRANGYMHSMYAPAICACSGHLRPRLACHDQAPWACRLCCNPAHLRKPYQTSLSTPFGFTQSPFYTRSGCFLLSRLGGLRRAILDGRWCP